MESQKDISLHLVGILHHSILTTAGNFKLHGLVNKSCTLPFDLCHSKHEKWIYYEDMY